MKRIVSQTKFNWCLNSQLEKQSNLELGKLRDFDFVIECLHGSGYKCNASCDCEIRGDIGCKFRV